MKREANGPDFGACDMVAYADFDQLEMWRSIAAKRERELEDLRAALAFAESRFPNVVELKPVTLTLEQVAARFFEEHGLDGPQHALICARAMGRTVRVETGSRMACGVAPDLSYVVDPTIEIWREELARALTFDLLERARIECSVANRWTLADLIARRDDGFERALFARRSRKGEKRKIANRRVLNPPSGASR